MSIADISDQEILEAVGSWGSHGCMTYVAANILRRKDKGIKTASVLRRLKKLEQQGLVQRKKSNYALQICWATTTEWEAS